MKPKETHGRSKRTSTLAFSFTRVPNFVLDGTHPWMTAKLIGVYAIARSYAYNKGFAFPGIGTIAKKAGISYRTTQRDLDKLERGGLISRRRRRQAASIIYFHDRTPESTQPILDRTREALRPDSTRVSDRTRVATEERSNEEDREQVRGPVTLESALAKRALHSSLSVEEMRVIEEDRRKRSDEEYRRNWHQTRNARPRRN